MRDTRARLTSFLAPRMATLGASAGVVLLPARPQTGRQVSLNQPCVLLLHVSTNAQSTSVRCAPHYKMTGDVKRATTGSQAARRCFNPPPTLSSSDRPATGPRYRVPANPPPNLAHFTVALSSSSYSRCPSSYRTLPCSAIRQRPKTATHHSNRACDGFFYPNQAS